MKKTIVWLSLILLLGLSTAAQESFLTPADNLVVEGVPKIPAALAEEAERYTNFRASATSSWHPVRREMLIGTRFGETTQIHLVKFPGGDRTQLTFYKDSTWGGSFQPTNGEYFIFSKGAGGNEQYRIYRYDLATGATTLLTDGKSRNTGGTWSNAGDKIVYSSTRRNGEDADLWVMNPLEPQSGKMLAEVKGGGWSVYDWSPDDKKILVGEYISANESYFWLMDAATGEKTLLTPKTNEQVSYGAAQFSKDGRGIFLTTDRESEFQRLAYFDLATKDYRYLTDHLKWDVDDFHLSHDGQMLAVGTNEDGAGVLHLFDARTFKEVPAPKLPVGVVSNLRWHRNSRDLAFGRDSGRNSYDAHSLDVKTGKVERWVFSETGGINTDNFAEAEIVKWKSFDDRTISGLKYRPPAKFTGKRPVIIEIHGGPEGQSRPYFQGQNNYFINELGIVILQPNVRGSTGYGKSFLKLDNGFLREDSYKDIGALLDWIKTQPDLDADRVMVTGGSYGGNMTLAVSYLYPDKIRCAQSVVGSSNFVTFLENTAAYRRDLRRVEYGDERDPKMREFLNRIAPLNNVAKFKKPLFVVQGANDPRVPLSESVQMVEAVRKNNTPVWYLMAKDEGHGFAKKTNRDFEFYATILFVKEYLLK